MVPGGAWEVPALSSHGPLTPDPWPAAGGGGLGAWHGAASAEAASKWAGPVQPPL